LNGEIDNFIKAFLMENSDKTNSENEL
jgi:hypothetical protein